MEVQKERWRFKKRDGGLEREMIMMQKERWRSKKRDGGPKREMEAQKER